MEKSKDYERDYDAERKDEKLNEEPMPTPYEKLASRDVSKQKFLKGRCGRRICRKEKTCSHIAEKNVAPMVELTVRKSDGLPLTANGIPLVSPDAFPTKESRDAALKEEAAFYVEQTKHCLIADFHRLQGSLGRDAALAFVQSEVIDPVF